MDKHGDNSEEKAGNIRAAPDRSEAARALGSVRSDAKKEAARERYARRIKEHGPLRRKLASLADIACTCGAGMNLEGHKSLCPRGRAIRRRKEKGQPLQ